MPPKQKQRRTSDYPIDDYHSYAEIERMTDKDIKDIEEIIQKGWNEEDKERRKSGYYSDEC